MMYLTAQVGSPSAWTTQERRFEFAWVPGGWWAVGALVLVAAICWAVFWMYRHEGRRGSTLLTRTVLAGVRCVSIAVLVLILLQPVLATYVHRWVDSNCIVLVDDSSSMDLRDQYRTTEGHARLVNALGEVPDSVRRADVVSTLVNGKDGLLEALTQRHQVRVYTFSDVATLAETLPSSRQQRIAEQERADAAGGGNAGGENQTGAPASERGDAAGGDAKGTRIGLAAQGPATNLSRALRRSLDDLGSAPLGGVVLISDGGFNQGDPVDAMARFVSEQRIPLHVVGVGDPSPPQNVRVIDVSAPENAFKQDPFSVTAHLSAQGMSGQTIVVELLESNESSGAGAEPVERRNVTVSADGSIPAQTFERRKERLGRFVYEVRVPVGPFETVTDDNSRSAAVNVIDDTMRVLLISGGPSWDYRFLSRLLVRDATFDVSCWLQSADNDAVRDGDTIIDHLPATPEELNGYDVVVMLDPDSQELGPGWARSVETLVSEHGSGLVYVASGKFTPQFMRDPALRRIVQMLPVTPDPEADLILNRIGHFQTRPWAVIVPPDAFGHPILKMDEDSSLTRAFWRDMANVYWHYPVLREKPVAKVLLRHGNPAMRNSYGSHVLMATQFVGSGRTAFVGFDSTWRWRRFGEHVYDRFWVQTLRYVVEGKLLGAKRRATLLTEGDTLPLGEAVRVQARLLDTRFEPMQADSAPATFTVENRRQEFSLSRVADRPGWFEGRFTPDQTGTYEIEVRLLGGGGEPVVARHSVRVARSNIEIANPRMNREALTALAAVAPEGGYYEIDSLASLVEAIPDRHETTTIRTRPLQLWDRWWTVAVLVGLLSVEWAVRKWVRLL